VKALFLAGLFSLHLCVEGAIISSVKMAEVKSLFVAPNKQKSIENEENVVAILLVKSGIKPNKYFP